MEITVQADRLTLKARRHWEAPPNSQPLAARFGAGDIQQTITLPGDVTTGAMQADCGTASCAWSCPRPRAPGPGRSR